MNDELTSSLKRASKYLWDDRLKVLGAQFDSDSGGNVIICWHDDLPQAIDQAIEHRLGVPFLVFHFQRDTLQFNGVQGIRYISIPVKIGEILKEFDIASEQVKYCEKIHGYSYTKYLVRMKELLTSH